MTRLWRTGDPIHAHTDANGDLLSFTWQGQSHVVAIIVNRWRVDLDWWDQRLCREYFKLTTATGLLVIVYHDLMAEAWCIQRLYD
ncbi:MAG: hypothetical protein IPO91_03205 [Chloroflexi bacterium]|nr:hypothetical protein [Chloroflexota bacterium]